MRAPLVARPEPAGNQNKAANVLMCYVFLNIKHNIF